MRRPARVPAVMAAAITAAAVFAAPAAAADGARVFAEVCAACHQDGGVGAPGLAPPLVDAPLWQRLGDAAPAYVAGVLLGGLSGTIEVAGERYIGLVMPPQDALDDASLAAVATYVLRDLNGVAVSVDPGVIAGLRGAIPSHGALRTMRKGG
ncbi:c-type cytochrome [Azospirillum halopraeferens]|uniref:c-type cytochrome n=1 Tax=Azospirillum halopraeferens TaxID=34010 RepID=UPI000A06C332|nr:cytochrome c [Azospirillum halopraeferens]